MAQEATIKINVEQGNSAKTLGDLKKLTQSVIQPRKLMTNLSKDKQRQKKVPYL